MLRSPPTCRSKQLSWYVDNTVSKELLSVSGLAAVDRNGGVDREIRVILDPAKLSAFGLTASQVNAQLRLVNLNAAGGRAEIGGSEQSVRVLGNAQTAYDLGQVQIAAGTGRTIRVADLGRVQDLYAEQRFRLAAERHASAELPTSSVRRARRMWRFSRRPRRSLPPLEARNPKVHFKLISDSVKYAKTAI